MYCILLDAALNAEIQYEVKFCKNRFKIYICGKPFFFSHAHVHNEVLSDLSSSLLITHGIG